MASHHLCTFVLTFFASQWATDFATRSLATAMRMRAQNEETAAGGDELDGKRDIVSTNTPVFQRRAADDSDGIEILEYDFKRQHTFQIAIGRLEKPPDSKMLEPAMLVLTTERAFAFLGSSRPTRPVDPGKVTKDEWQYCDDEDAFEGCSFPHETSSIDTATITVETFYEPEEQREKRQGCMRLTGCDTANCDGPFQVWLICSDRRHVLHEFALGFDELYCTRNNLQDRLGPEIVRAAGQSLQPSFGAFSPFILNGTNSDFGHKELEAVKEQFKSRVMPYRPGKNSGSGASFFWSKDKKYVAKRIRGWEFNELWQVTRDGVYQDRILQGTSVLNPVYLAFMWGAVPWIVMLTAKMPDEVNTYIKSVHRFSFAHVLDEPRIHKFKMDIKVKPMTSDRIKMLQLALREHALKNAFAGTSQAWLDTTAWARLEERVNSDVEYLGAKSLVDYSFLVHGAVFERPVSRGALGGPEARRFGTMVKAVEDRPDCIIDCPLHDERRHQRRLVDVTEYVKRVNNQIVVSEATYKCCCSKLPNWDGAVVRSPCVLVNTAAPPQKRFAINRTGCDNLLEGKWHSYSSAEKLPYTNGRCIVGVGVWPGTAFPEGPLGSTFYQGTNQLFVDPMLAFGIDIPRARPPCSVVCVNVLDYLLPYNFRSLHGLKNSAENLVLIPIYFAAKWTNYGQRMTELLRCMAEAPLRFQKSGFSQLATTLGSVNPIAAHAKSNYTIENLMVEADSVASTSTNCEDVLDDQDTSFIEKLFEDLLIKVPPPPSPVEDDELLPSPVSSASMISEAEESQQLPDEAMPPADVRHDKRLLDLQMQNKDPPAKRLRLGAPEVTAMSQPSLRN